MANLKQSINPARAMTWKGKSLANCSRDELIECVIFLAGQIAEADRKIKTYETAISNTVDMMELAKKDKQEKANESIWKKARGGAARIFATFRRLISYRRS